MKQTYVIQFLTGLGMIGALILMVISMRFDRHGLFIVQGCCLLVLGGLFYWQTVIRARL